MLAISLCHLIKKMCGGNIAYRRAAPAAVFTKVVIQKHQQTVGMDKQALIVNYAQAVCVAVCRDAEVALVFHNKVRKRGQCFAVWRGQTPTEQSIMALVDDVYITARC